MRALVSCFQRSMPPLPRSQNQGPSSWLAFSTRNSWVPSYLLTWLFLSNPLGQPSTPRGRYIFDPFCQNTASLSLPGQPFASRRAQGHVPRKGPRPGSSLQRHLFPGSLQHFSASELLTGMMAKPPFAALVPSHQCLLTAGPFGAGGLVSHLLAPQRCQKDKRSYTDARRSGWPHFSEKNPQSSGYVSVL